MLPILLSTVVWALAAIGLGRFVLRDEDLAHEEPELRIAVLGFTGLLLIAVLGLWTNIVAPVGPLVSVATLAAGLFRLPSTLRDLRHLQRASAVLLLACLVLTSGPGQVPGLYGDQGLYYVQAVEWARSARAPLGLANLHGRLGFNSSWFPLAAVMELPGLRGKSSFAMSLLPLLFGCGAVLAAVARLRKGDWSLDTALLAALAVPVCFASLTLASMSPDGALWVMTFLCVALWARAFARPEAFGSCAVAASALSVFAFTIKTSALPLALVSAALLAARRSVIDRAKQLRLFVVCIALVVPWLVRGVMTSGCLLYPVPGTCIESLSWAVSREDAALMQDWIASWARAPGMRPTQVLGSWRWLGPWARRTLQDPAALAALLLFGGGVLAARGKLLRAGAAFWAPAVLCTATVLFCFVTAPDPRFALGLLLGLGLLPVCFALADRANQGPLAERTHFRRRTSWLAACGCVLLLAGLNARLVVVARRADFTLVSWPMFPRPDFRQVMTVGGTVVNTPVGTDQCWETPLPCAPDRVGLAFRGPFARVPGTRATPTATTSSGTPP